MSEWEKIKLSAISNRITSGGTPSTKNPYFYGGEIPWLNTKEINFNRVTVTEKKITCEGLNNSSAKWIDVNSVVVAMYGATAGKVAINKIPLTTNQACCNLTINEEIADYEYVYYNLVNNYNELENLAVGAAQQNLNVSVIADFEVLLPSLQEQKAIASVLSSLDDKIVLLHRQNKTLEAMAETLFRQWFVEETKEEWEEGVLSDFLTVRYGKDHKNLLDGVVPVIGSGGVMRYADTFLCNKESVLIPRKGSLNNVMYLDEPFWTVDTMFFTEMKKENSAKFIYFFIKEVDLASMNVGSAVPSMTTDLLNNMPLTIPPDALLEQFEDLIQPLFLKIKANRIQIRVLSTIRDTMLPKLMNGEVRVKL